MMGFLISLEIVLRIGFLTIVLEVFLGCLATRVCDFLVAVNAFFLVAVFACRLALVGDLLAVFLEVDRVVRFFVAGLLLTDLFVLTLRIYTLLFS